MCSIFVSFRYWNFRNKFRTLITLCLGSSLWKYIVEYLVGTYLISLKCSDGLDNAWKKYIHAIYIDTYYLYQLSTYTKILEQVYLALLPFLFNKMQVILDIFSTVSLTEAHYYYTCLYSSHPSR